MERKKEKRVEESDGERKRNFIRDRERARGRKREKKRKRKGNREKETQKFIECSFLYPATGPYFEDLPRGTVGLNRPCQKNMPDRNRIIRLPVFRLYTMKSDGN